MVIIELTYKKDLSEVDKYVELHRGFLDKYYNKGLFVASGPKKPRNGGVIVALLDAKSVNKVIAEDPFYQQEIADYSVIEFEATRGVVVECV
ncbi:MAG: YciI family protein [Coxiellaceae bacterium]|nr:YciI family protein [Coxiellaceae bacterium]